MDECLKSLGYKDQFDSLIKSVNIQGKEYKGDSEVTLEFADKEGKTAL